ncbi:hypothetical protein [Aerolutibacter ruishenii]|uniref:Lipoprotein n=1 Tax=Aerolutibacter ruishenii TaxID=686800 RepID=A0A562LPH1_9GAMM|nr:hypothetical protein [Lysobacter ruishenii]TWI09512.1 hypothetical protein IP93_02129 [Lysobacter ruishenii]
MPLLRPVYLLLACALLSACGGDDAANAKGANGAADEALPAPAGTSGSVTGMPDQPGPGPVGAQGVEPAPVSVDADGNPLLPADAPVDGVPADGLAVDGVPAETATEPGPTEAVGLVRDYYAAINRGDFARAYALWSDGGRASGQSPQDFAAGFTDTVGVSVQIGTPGAVEGAAGSRYVQVPVTLVARQRDGSERAFAGSFTLRRAVIDGATDEQRAWRIASANLREGG